ncbi:hypothetical protein THAOC_30951 [Thalassiosira oceanica]|uniref:Uncharacterized protein n=1 Tax=Thalassiosira oceanica TaxID=159749 RepID=K0R974_THAOC|nr:hypothetical protein THAOC_30951 [Thalassiosira oceanica]|eukprot:EJK50113.1 hypothetical protein THAOC_30951 [Thalassiosira oceanica]
MISACVVETSREHQPGASQIWPPLEDRSSWQQPEDLRQSPRAPWLRRVHSTLLSRDMGNAGSSRPASAPASSAGSARSATPMDESPPQRRRDKQPPSTPPRGLASPRPTSFFPRTDAEIRSSQSAWGWCQR